MEPNNNINLYEIGKDKQEYNRFKQYRIKSNILTYKRSESVGQLLGELYPPFI